MATKKTFESANNETVLNALLDSDQTLNSLGIGTAAIIQGFIGVVEAIRFDEVSGQGIRPRDKALGRQEVNIVGVGPVVLAEVNDQPVSLFIIFEGGSRKIAIPALFQNPASQIEFRDGSSANCMKMTGKQWKSLIGCTLECVHAQPDESLMIPRPSRVANATTGQQEMRPSRVYKFVVTNDPNYGIAGATPASAAGTAEVNSATEETPTL